LNTEVSFIKLLKENCLSTVMKLVFTPDWFLGGDVLIEVVSFIVLSLFVYFCIKNYKLGKKKSFLWLGLGFALIALAEVSTIFTKLVLYYDTSFTQTIGKIVVTYTVTKSVDIFYYIGFFFHKILTLCGLYVIYKIPFKKGLASDFFLGLYFLIVAAVFSQLIYYVFHLTAFGLLAMIINNYSEVYRKNRSENTLLLIIAFGGLLFSQAIAILSRLNILYVLAQSLQLVSYIILLFLIFRILKYGKKKKSH